MDRDRNATLTAAALALMRLLDDESPAAQQIVNTMDLAEAGDLARAASLLEDVAQRRYMTCFKAEPDDETRALAESARAGDLDPSPSMPPPERSGPLRDPLDTVIGWVGQLAPEDIAAMARSLDRHASPRLELVRNRPGADDPRFEFVPARMEIREVRADDGEVQGLDIVEVSYDEVADWRDRVNPPYPPVLMGPIVPRTQEEIDAMIERCRDQLPPGTAAFMGKPVRRNWPLGVECPVCHAEAGEPCVTPTEVVMDPHDDRVVLANGSSDLAALNQGRDTVEAFGGAEPEWSSDAALKVECPICQAQPGDLCTVVNDFDGAEQRGIHLGRIPMVPDDDPDAGAMSAPGEVTDPHDRQAALDRFDAEHPPVEPTPMKTGVDGLRDYMARNAVQQGESEDRFLAHERQEVAPLREAMQRGLGMVPVQFHDPEDCGEGTFTQQAKTGVWFCEDCGRPVRPREDPESQK